MRFLTAAVVMEIFTISQFCSVHREPYPHNTNSLLITSLVSASSDICLSSWRSSGFCEIRNSPIFQPISQLQTSRLRLSRSVLLFLWTSFFALLSCCSLEKVPSVVVRLGLHFHSRRSSRWVSAFSGRQFLLLSIVLILGRWAALFGLGFFVFFFLFFLVEVS